MKRHCGHPACDHKVITLSVQVLGVVFDVVIDEGENKEITVVIALEKEKKTTQNTFENKPWKEDEVMSQLS